MLIPDYWAEARTQGTRNGRPVTVRRFGWSNTSQTDAQTNADARAAAALTRIIVGEPLPRRDLKRAYNGSEGVPIREEVIERRGDAVITRNSYGALCLNTPDCLFADIDFHDGPRLGLTVWSVIVFLVVAVASSPWVGLREGLVLALIGLILAYPFTYLEYCLMMRYGGGSEARARSRIENWLLLHRDWHLQLYRTPAGLRLMAVHATFDPADPIVAKFFRAIGADPVYARMCLRQNCFRARVSPKPWRIGIGPHIRPQSVWPIDPEKLPERRRWLDEYEHKAKDFSACQYLDSLGSGLLHPKVHDVQRWHDELCRARVPLPSA